MITFDQVWKICLKTQILGWFEETLFFRFSRKRKKLEWFILFFKSLFVVQFYTGYI